jgi:hypothetical protein
VVAYVVPALVVLGGIGAVAFIAIKRRRRYGGAAASTNGSLSPALAGEDAARLDADLERYDL